MRVIIVIIDIITISLNSTAATKIVRIRWQNFTDVYVSEQWNFDDNHGIYGNIV